MEKKTDVLNEQQLVVRLKNRDSQAFTVIYNLYAQKLYRYAVKFIKSPEIAEDVVHDIFVKLWDNVNELQIESSLQAYLYKIAQRQLLNIIKRSAVEVKIIDEIINNTTPYSQCTEDSLLYKETFSHTTDAINKLPSQRKLIFELGRNKGLSHKQIARQLNIADSTVNNQMVKALKSIKSHLLLKGSIGLSLIIACLFK